MYTIKNIDELHLDSKSQISIGKVKKLIIYSEKEYESEENQKPQTPNNSRFVNSKFVYAFCDQFKTASQQELKSLFEKYGLILSIRKSKKKCWVTFATADNAMKCMDLDGCIFGGSRIGVELLPDWQ